MPSMLEAPGEVTQFPGLQLGPGMQPCQVTTPLLSFRRYLGSTKSGCSSSDPNTILEYPPSGLCIAPPSGTLSPSLGSPWKSCAGVTRPVGRLLSVPHPGSPPGKPRLPPGLQGTPCYLCWGPGFSRGLKQQGGPRLVGVGCKANKGISTQGRGLGTCRTEPRDQPWATYLSREPRSVHL